MRPKLLFTLSLKMRKDLGYREGWRPWQGAAPPSAAGWPASPVWTGEAGAEAAGGGRAEEGPQTPGAAGGEEGARPRRCCEVGPA